MSKRVKTITITSAKTEIVFNEGYLYYWITNLSDNQCFVSISPTIADGLDGTFTVAPGSSCGTMHGYPTNKLYAIGNGKIQICGTNIAVNPFKSAVKGGGGGSSKYYSVSISASDWLTNASGGYVCTKAVTGLLSSDYMIADIVLSTDYAAAVLQLDAWKCVCDGNIINGNDSIDFYCYTTKPTVDIAVRLGVIH